MSALESNAKPSLLRVLGTATERSVFNDQESQALSEWAVLKAIVGEHASEDPLTPVEDRNAFRMQRSIPSYFRVFIALHSSKVLTAYQRHSATLSASLDGPDPRLPKGITRNVQTTVLLVGRLCVYVIAVRVHGVRADLLDPIRPMHRIYPALNGSVELTATPALTDVDLYLVAGAIDRLTRHPQVKYGGEIPD